MIRIIADTHTHTMTCDHAYSTFNENLTAARHKGLRFLVSTEHGPAMPGGPSIIYFQNLGALPRSVGGVVLIRGAEVNIMDYEGGLDINSKVLERLELVIASMHIPCLKPATKEQHTAGWLAVAENPDVDIVGHLGDERYAFDHKAVIQALAKNGKVVEINAHSFSGRPGSKVNCPAIAKLCARYEVPVVVSSDAHFWASIGDFGAAVEVLEEIGFPQELILNADSDRFLQFARRVSGKTLTDEPDIPPLTGE